MNTNKRQTETKFDRDLDPYADQRIFPGQWDLSDMPAMTDSPEDPGLFPEEDDWDIPDHGLAPGAMDEWHLAAYFDDHPARHRRDWSAY